MNFLGRSVVQLASKLLQEVSPDLQPVLDTTQMLRSISYLNPASGVRTVLDDWDLAPGKQEHSTEFGCTRSQIPALWDDAIQRKLRFFPELVDSEYWDRANAPSSGADGGPLASQKGKSKSLQPNAVS